MNRPLKLTCSSVACVALLAMLGCSASHAPGDSSLDLRDAMLSVCGPVGRAEFLPLSVMIETPAEECVVLHMGRRGYPVSPVAAQIEWTSADGVALSEVLWYAGRCEEWRERMLEEEPFAGAVSASAAAGGVSMTAGPVAAGYLLHGDVAIDTPTGTLTLSLGNTRIFPGGIQC